MKQDLKQSMEEIHQKAPNSAPNDLWNRFHDSIQESMAKHIPTKTARKKNGLPYITPEILKLIRRRDQLNTRKGKGPRKILNTQHLTTK